MKRIDLKIETLSPLLLGAGPEAHNLTETMETIPGNSIRGLLAWQYLESKGNSPGDKEFIRLFLTGDTCFGFGTISGAEVIPLSARTCKYYPGFKGEGAAADADAEKHGVVDILLTREHKPCPACQKPIDYMEGFYDPAKENAIGVKKRLISHTAIDPDLGTAAEGQLYTHRVISEGQTFISTIEIPDDLSASLEKLLDKPFTAGIGTARSRGKGWIRVEKTDLTERVWGGAAERSEPFKDETGRHRLGVTLLSDGIFCDEYLRDRTAPAAADLAGLGIDPKDWEPEPSKAFADTRMVFGFDGDPLRLPRIPRLAVSAGSVFLFNAVSDSPVIPGGDGLGWIGENNGEGFGRALLWHPFHNKYRA